MATQLRAALNSDSEQIIDLIARCYADYPPNVLDVDGEEPELRSPASSFDGFWVLEQDGEIVGCIAAANYGAHIEMKKYYVHPKMRGTGQGRLLHTVFLNYALEQGVSKIELWTDTRFELAHHVYTHLGYRQTGRTRELHDLSETTEFHFEMVLS
ncbi:MAG: GNAT family N-acetyltransferase [Planctomycetota bacterium]|jgi:N-acetylglutamate synthase-like GNAT family acetyltransferase|nr:GNAT family N-acetyltransferase [Planctomycetota bacterium]